MKKVSIALFAFILSGSVFAQKSIGVRGAFTASTVTKFDLIENVTPDFKFMPSAGGAVFMELPIMGNFSVQPEIVYTQKGFMINESLNMGGKFLGVDIPVNGKVNFRTNYVEMPVLAKFHIGDKESAHYYFMLGPSLGVFTDAGMTVRVLNIFPIKTDLNSNMFKPIELSGIAAMGFELPVAEKVMIFTEARYQHGFSRILDTPVVQLPVRNRTLSGGMGIKIKI